MTTQDHPTPEDFSENKARHQRLDDAGRANELAAIAAHNNANPDSTMFAILALVDVIRQVAYDLYIE
jgi:hypothetical protein